eukprot:UN21289
MNSPVISKIKLFLQTKTTISFQNQNFFLKQRNR